MKLLKTQPYMKDSELKSYMESQKEVRAFRDWQIIYSVQTNQGFLATKISIMLGVEKSKIYRVIQLYNKHGKNWRIYGKWGGRREERSKMSIEQESSLLKKLEKEALSGKIIIYRHVKNLVEQELGQEVSDDYIWDMFKRHNWKKKVPRQSHPKADKEKQEEYKKNSKRFWQPNH